MGDEIDILTGYFHIRTIVPSDKEDFMAIRKEASDMAKAYIEYPEFVDYIWQKTMADEDEISLIVFRKEDEQTVAICSFQDFSGDHVDIGYDVAREYRGQGIGTSVARDMISLARQVFPEKKIIIRVRNDNKASQHIAEKCGGRLAGREPTPVARYTMSMLEKYGTKTEGERRLSESEIDAMKRIVESDKEGILVYEII